MVERGADLIDIGGESTRPGADPVTAAEEIDRVVPVLERLRSADCRSDVDRHLEVGGRAAPRSTQAPRSSTTSRASCDDPEIAAVAARRGAALVLMHTRGTPKTMGDAAVYDDVVSDVIGELRAAIDRATARGMPMEGLIVDPGIGFAKRPSHSYGVLARLESSPRPSTGRFWSDRRASRSCAMR